MNEPPGDPYIQWNQQYGGIIRYSFPMYSQRIAIIDPEYTKHILVTHCSKYRKPTQTRSLLIGIIGDGLILLEGQEHARAQLVPTFQSFAEVLVNYWQNEIDEHGGSKATLDVHKDLSRITLDAICKSAFDYDCNALTDKNNEVSVAFAKVLGGLTLNWTYFIPGFKYLPTPSNIEGKRALSICHGTVRKVIDEKLKKENIGEEKCLLDILLSLRDEDNNAGFTRNELQDHVMTFMSAGHETISVALAWTLYALATNPAVQEKVRQEICKVIQPGDNITWDTFDDLPYLDNVIKESLRLYPPVPMTFRQAIADDKIGEYFIPKGTMIAIIPPYRNPKYYDEPLQFEPDRWNNSAKNASPYVYLPFLRGPRICIGSKFATTEIKCILSSLLKNFSFQPYPDQPVERKLQVTMRPHPSLKLIVSSLLPS
ncbi:Cytochrome P450 4V2 [Trichoplax sp. H2]|nr:Cytochrome P450 4V2 [Trichoplax sp. H2]|eukprot:RDD40331.1 Cytochrome P450 4V2 [Trichoplax sp. H2]